MKTFRDFMEDGAGAMGSGAAGAQSSGGSPAIATSTAGVKGTGDDSSTVPVSKKKPSSLHARANRVKEVKEGLIKNIKRGLTGWQKGMHDVDTVKAATKTLSPEQKKTVLADKVGKGSPAHLQQKLIKRELRKQVKEDSPRRITSSIKVGEKTAPAETFMTKEESQLDELSKGMVQSYLNKAEPELEKSQKIIQSNASVKKWNKAFGSMLKRGAGERNASRKLAGKARVNATEETVKSQKEIVASNSKTEQNPTGAIPKGKKLFNDVRMKD